MKHLNVLVLANYFGVPETNQIVECLEKLSEFRIQLTDLSVLNIHRRNPGNVFGSSRNIVCNIRCDIVLNESVVTNDFLIQSNCFMQNK